MVLYPLSRYIRRITVNIQASYGSTLVDSNGKSYIDLCSHIASMPLGYNHPNLIPNPTLASHRMANNLFPSMEFEKHIDDVFPKISPYKNTNVKDE